MYAIRARKSNFSADFALQRSLTAISNALGKPPIWAFLSLSFGIEWCGLKQREIDAALSDVNVFWLNSALVCLWIFRLGANNWLLLLSASLAVKSGRGHIRLRLTAC